MFDRDIQAGLSSVTHFAWFSRIYFKTRIHARIEQFVSFVMHFPISKVIFETEFENQKKIRFPNEYYIVPLYTSASFCRCYTGIFCVTDLSNGVRSFFFNHLFITTLQKYVSLIQVIILIMIYKVTWRYPWAFFQN